MPMTPHPWAGRPVRPDPVFPEWQLREQPRAITQLCGGAERLFALCNDGSVWELLGGVWLPTPGIPQRQVGGEE